jgi:biotin carboxyl carrier protein
MQSAPRAALASLAAMSACTSLAPAMAQGDTAAGAPALSSAPAASTVLAGGAEYGAPTVVAEHPALSALSTPAVAAAGTPPRLMLRIDEAGVATVYAQVRVMSLSTHRPVIILKMGWVHTGRTLTVSWPRGALLRSGSYEVSVSAHDHHGGELLHETGDVYETTLKVSKPVKRSPTATAPSVPPATPPPAGVPTPAQTVADGAVFPVDGPHNFGGPENRFGAPRAGYLHQGQDVLTAEGTPVLAPLAGTILTTSYQAGGAGYYAVEQTSISLDFMFAHCQAASLAVTTGQAVAAGTQLCRAGQTGDATAPHLDFEIWVEGWQAPGGYPIDPLPYLEAWDHPAAAG